MASTTATVASTEAAAAAPRDVVHHMHGDNCLGARSIKVESTVAPPAVDMTLHAENRARLAARVRTHTRVAVPEKSIILLAGGASEHRHDTDHEPAFRQESNFHWAFGVKEPDCLGTIDVDTGRSCLYIPRLPAEYAVWMGPIRDCESFRLEYGVDEVRYCDQLRDTVRAHAPGAVLVLKGMNTDGDKETKPAHFDGIEEFTREETVLYPAIAECRVFKSKKELDLLRFICTVSSEAHLAVLQHTRPGLKEYQLESLFKHWCYYHGGARFMSYTCICATGNEAAVLHYGHAGEPNAHTIKDGSLCLFDMGSEFHCYGSDITTTFPANGKFTADQRFIYEAVLAAQHAVMDAMRPGVSWVAMHELAYRTLLTRLRDGGLLTGDVDEMMAVNLGATFMSHGLGHFLGIDTHDVGGYPAGVVRDARPGYKSLRTGRVLAAGMYITVEPGCYFINHLLDAALADESKRRFINAAMLARFRGFGGVRIEDDVLVTDAGIENFTHAPRTVAEIEAVCAGRITQRAELTKFH